MQPEPFYITESKKRCKENGLNPAQFPMPKNRLSQKELENKRMEYDEVLSVTNLFTEKIMSLLKGTPILILFTDEEGYVLEMYGDETIKNLVTQIGIMYGIQLNEESMGTNAIYLALQERHPVEVIGEHHYHLFLHSWACYSVPFHFPEIDNLSGTISFMISTDYHSPYQLALLSTMMDSVMREILLRRKNRKQYLLNHIMMNTFRNGIIVTDKFGNVTEFNQFAEKITDCSKEAIIGRSIFEFEPIGKYIYGVLKKGEKHEDIELTFTNSLPQNFICLFDALPIYDDKSELIGAYAQFRDITDRRLLENQVIVSEKLSAIGKLAAGLAHEIRNPLTAITGFIQLLKNRYAANQPEARYIEIVHNELLRVNKLVSNFVVMARPGVPDKKRCVLQEILQETVQFMESQAILKNVAIQAEFHDDPVVLLIDPMQIKQVLINLIQNAIEAMTSGGNIHVLLEEDADKNEVKIKICDTGVGMTEEELKQILNPFFTTKENGLGLGLSVCYRIVESHKGRIEVTSRKGAGTTFTIVLPVQHPAN